jgi:ATP-dependent DNA ligase
MSASRELQRQLKRFALYLPRPAKKPPARPCWIHEIKHDGFRILAERDVDGVTLRTRRGYDFADRFLLAAAAVAKLPVRSCLIEGEAFVCHANALALTRQSVHCEEPVDLRPRLTSNRAECARILPHARRRRQEAV